MSLKPMSLNQNSKDTTSNEIPDWIDLDANESVDIHLLIDSTRAYEATYAVRTSKLPREVIDDLLRILDPVKMFTRAGFGIGRTFGNDDAVLEAFVFKEVLGKYNEDFLKIITPYVVPGSYIEMEDEDGLRYKWKFDGSYCYKSYQD